MPLFFDSMWSLIIIDFHFPKIYYYYNRNEVKGTQYVLNPKSGSEI